jgi:thiol-disulfide isomerase/thioredoxin
MHSRKMVIWISCLALICCLGATSLAVAAEAEPKVGQSVGIVKFNAPLSDDEAKYLGLAKAQPFSLTDVKAPYVLVEQFNTSCPHCMHQAPIMDQLYEKVEKDPQLKAKVKFIGTGQGNDETQLKMWKAFQKVPFALVPDPNSTFGKALNFSPYPVTVLLDKTGKILFVNIGAFENADEVLAKIKTLAK